MSDDIVTRPEEEIDFVEYLRLWQSTNPNDRAVRDLHKAADEIERLRAEVARLTLVSSLWESEFVAAVDEIKRLGQS